MEFSFKATRKSCVDTAVFLGKANEDILTYRKEKIKPELDQNYRHVSVEKEEHPKLLFDDHLPKILKAMAKTNKVGQSLTQRPRSSSSTRRCQNSFLYKSRGTLKEVISPCNIFTSCKEAKDLTAFDSTRA